MLTAADFTNNAQDEAAILQMFRTNIVMISYSPSANTPGVHNLGVVAGFNNNNAWVGRDANGNLIDVNTVKNFTGHVGTTFRSYWCPYESQNCKQAWLGGQANYMFTAKMDGCTFAIGTPTLGGGRIVAHANAGGDGHAQLDQIRGKAAFSTDRGMKTLAPSSYYFKGNNPNTGSSWKIQATTFGIRLADGTWTFYTQTIKYDSSQKTMDLVAVVPIA